MKKRKHWWMVVDREYGFFFPDGSGFLTRAEARAAWLEYPGRTLYKVIKVVQP